MTPSLSDILAVARRAAGAAVRRVPGSPGGGAGRSRGHGQAGQGAGHRGRLRVAGGDPRGRRRRLPRARGDRRGGSGPFRRARRCGRVRADRAPRGPGPGPHREPGRGARVDRPSRRRRALHLGHRPHRRHQGLPAPRPVRRGDRPAPRGSAGGRGVGLPPPGGRTGIAPRPALLGGQGPGGVPGDAVGRRARAGGSERGERRRWGPRPGQRGVGARRPGGAAGGHRPRRPRRRLGAPRQPGQVRGGGLGDGRGLPAAPVPARLPRLHLGPRRRGGGGGGGRGTGDRPRRPIALDFSLGARLEANRGVLVSNGRVHDLVLEALAAAGGRVGGYAAPPTV